MIYFDNSATTQVLPEVLSTYNAVSENNEYQRQYQKWRNDKRRI